MREPYIFRCMTGPGKCRMVGKPTAYRSRSELTPATRPGPPRCLFMQREGDLMADQRVVPRRELKTSRQIYDDSIGVHRQVDDGLPRLSEDDMQRARFGPRGVPGRPDPAVMVPQRRKKTPTDFDPGHTA